MIKGSTIIFNDEYISELKRHIDNARRQLDTTIDSKVRQELEEKVDYLSKKLEYALDFQDTVDQVINVEVPRITTVKTISGVTLPLRIVQII